jgi:predicted ATPase
MTHLKSVALYPDRYPTGEYYPFNLSTFQVTRRIDFDAPVTFFVGENGTGKSTLLEAISHKAGIHIWQNDEGPRFDFNPYEEDLHKYISVEWFQEMVPGSFFSGENFRDFSRYLEEWAINDPAMLTYFGGKSLMTQSHGQSLLSFFKARYRIKGLYLLDEPETALSPRSQLVLQEILKDMSRTGQAQFIVASHSPILLACPGARIYSFDHVPVRQVMYEETELYLLYRDFMINRKRVVDAGTFKSYLGNFKDQARTDPN